MGSRELDTTEHARGHVKPARPADVRIQVEMVTEQLDAVLDFRSIEECSRENRRTDSPQRVRRKRPWMRGLGP